MIVFLISRHELWLFLTNKFLKNEDGIYLKYHYLIMTNHINVLEYHPAPDNYNCYLLKIIQIHPLHIGKF